MCFRFTRDFVESQLNAVCSDLNVCGIKIGMLAQVEIINLVADFLESYGCEEIVLDPVMVSQSGHRLLEEDAVQTLKKRLLPICRIVTPNLYEASILAGSQMDENSNKKYGGVGVLNTEHGGEQCPHQRGARCRPQAKQRPSHAR